MIQNNFDCVRLYLLSQIPNLNQLLILFGLRACRILGPWPGIRPGLPAVEGGVLLGHRGCQGRCLSLAGWHFRRYFKPFRYLTMVLIIWAWAVKCDFPMAFLSLFIFLAWKKAAELLCGVMGSSQIRDGAWISCKGQEHSLPLSLQKSPRFLSFF